ncbi:GlxA family transcriptional regulator [Streptomyces camelliae]|uniref:Helix-turn-helix domain-containing protein n=1 Tax=Streptomyces camelliae TaxID=3004093 RepID=A0ABY7PDJ4_9ACTN|nr:helix-turn-helix domain-containing protein [Streptomyces sp. HUAS 2-6]WBO68694.1 helix-turn-helix domain-containing protein [Streptomyces sp. HUAS 2-6]
MNTHRVAVLAVDGVLPMDLGIPTQIFNARPNTPYELTVCGDTQETVTTSSGFTLGLTAGLEALGEADTVIVPGFADYRRPPHPRVTAALERAGRAGTRTVSICTGAFALAAAGLLDDRTVTTHWASADELEALYPRLRVDRNVLYIDNGTILTSAGVTAGIDLCLYLVRKDLGAAVANDIARELVAAPHRDGGQAQYITRSLPTPQATTLAATRTWALRRLDEALTIPRLATHAGVSPRTLTRLWRQETGVSPHQWLMTARVNRARELLETTDLQVEQIAARCGLGSGTNLRARFRDAVAVTPTAYRRAFRHRAS